MCNQQKNKYLGSGPPTVPEQGFHAQEFYREEIQNIV